MVVRTYNPNPRRGLEPPPELVPKELFEQAVLRLLPSLAPTDLSHLTAVFRAPFIIFERKPFIRTQNDYNNSNNSPNVGKDNNKRLLQCFAHPFC